MLGLHKTFDPKERKLKKFGKKLLFQKLWFGICPFFQSFHRRDESPEELLQNLMFWRKKVTRSAVQTASFFPFGDHAAAETFCIPSIAGIKFLKYLSCIGKRVFF